VHVMDALEFFRQCETESIHCIVTSPPYYGLRDYAVEGQLGLEASPQEYIDNLVEIFREGRRALRSDGVFYLNLGDSFANLNRTEYATGEIAGKNKRKN